MVAAVKLKSGMAAIAVCLAVGAAWGLQEQAVEGPAIPVEARPKGKRDPLEFWFEPARARAGAAAQLVLAQHPYTVAALRIAGNRLQVWSEAEFIGDQALPLNERWLAAISSRDGKPMPNLSKLLPDQVSAAQRDYIAIYNQAVLYAFQTPVEAFVNSARDNPNVNFARMYEQTDRLRGKVIAIKGHLRRLSEFDAPGSLRARGIQHIYEGWIALPGSEKMPPICVVFPRLPEKVQPADNMNRWVEFYGYLINRYKYRSGRGDLQTPFLIGPTLIPAPQPPPENSELVTPAVLYGFVGFVFVVALAVVALNLWFRRGDRRVREYLASRQAERSVEAWSESPEQSKGPQ